MNGTPYLSTMPRCRTALLFGGAAIAAVGGFVLFPDNLGLLTQIVIMMIFVLSLDLALGYAGIATLGHAALFGSGAYAAGLFAVHVSPAPLPGLIVGGVAGAVVAWGSGLLLLRNSGLSLLMLSIAVAMVLQETANQARAITGGADGLTDIVMDPILGAVEFDLLGQTGYWYAVAVLFVVLLVMRRIVASPFGHAIRGVHDSAPRMRAIGTPVYRRLLTAYVMAGVVAGIAGALSAQVTELVSLDVFDFSLSAEAIVMLVLGGAGRLYGALIGTAVFMAVHHWAASVDPFNWLFIIAGLILIVVFAVPSGIVGVPKTLQALVRKR